MVSLTFIHQCGMGGERCPAHLVEVNVHEYPVFGGNTAYRMPELRCIYTNDKLKLIRINGKGV